MYYFIVNYYGGSGKAQRTWNRVHFLLKKKNVEYKAYVTKRPGHAKHLAERISTLDDDDIRMVVVGGDGTINEAINGVKDFSRISFGVIPTGSGNDFARGMGIPKDTEKALDLILNAEKGRMIDVGEVMTDITDKHRFLISSGIGLDAIVCKKMDTSKVKKVMNKLKMGSLSYIILTVTSLFKMKTYKVKLKIMDDHTKDDEEVYLNDLIFFAAMNFSAEGGGVPMNPGAEPDDGKLSICAVSGIPKWKTFFLLPSLRLGKHGKKKGFLLRDAEGLVFDSETEMVLHTDGEYVGDVKHVEMFVMHYALRGLV